MESKWKRRIEAIAGAKKVCRGVAPETERVIKSAPWETRKRDTSVWGGWEGAEERMTESGVLC